MTRRVLFNALMTPFLRVADDLPVWAVRCRCSWCTKIRTSSFLTKDGITLVGYNYPIRMTRAEAQKILDRAPQAELVFLPEITRSP